MTYERQYEFNLKQFLNDNVLFRVVALIRTVIITYQTFIVSYVHKL